MDEQVAEPEGVLARERRTVWPDQFFTDQRQETIRDACAGLMGRQCLDRPQVEDVPLDGRALDRLALLVAELVEA